MIIRPAYYLVFLTIATISGYGCGTTQSAEQSPPNLVKMTEMPQLTENLADVEEMQLRVAFHVNSDGLVNDVIFRTTSGDSLWDASAIDSMKTWRFDSSYADSSYWFMQLVTARFMEIQIMNLAVITSENAQVADSLARLIRSTGNFDELYYQQQTDDTPYFTIEILNNHKISDLPQYVRDAVRHLEEGGVTRPIMMDGNYVIYKRIRKQTVVAGIN